MAWLLPCLMLIVLSGCGKFENEFFVRSVDSNIVVSRDGSALVSETFDVDVKNASNYGGVYVDIPQRFTDAAGRTRWRNFSLATTRRDGIDEHYSMENTLRGGSIYIGLEHCKRCDSDLPMGGHTFEIAYRLGRLVHDEAGKQLLVLPAYMASVHDRGAPKTLTIRLPGGGTIRPSRQAVGADYQIVANSPTEITIAIPRGRGDRLLKDIEIEYPSGTFARPAPVTLLYWWFLDHLLLISILLGPMMVGLLAAFRLRAYAKPVSPQAVADSNLPKTISPALAAFLERDWSDAARRPAFLAAVCRLAIQGRFRLSGLREAAEISDLRTKASSAEPRRKRAAREKVWKSGSAVLEHLKKQASGEGRARLGDAMVRFGDGLKTVAQLEYREARGKGARVHGWLACLVFMIGCYLAYITGLMTFTGAACLMIILPFIVGSWLLFPERRPKPSGAFGELKTAFSMLIGLPAVFFAAYYYVSIHMITTEEVPYFLAIMLDMVGAIAALVLLRLPTLRQRRIRANLGPLRRYLLGEERGPAMSVEVYERYLPFATALGAEPQWSAAFERWRQAENMPVYAPDWMREPADPRQSTELSL